MKTNEIQCMKWTLIFCYIFCAHCIAKVPISVESDIYDFAKQLIGEKNVHTIDNFKHPSCLRDVVEFVVVQKAIKLGGLDIEFDYVPGDYDARNIRLIQHGLLLISFDTIWLNEAQNYKEDVYISDPIVRNGEFYAGIYVAADKVRDLKPKLKHGLQHFSFVTSDAWYTDVKTLTSLQIKNLVIESDWLVMAKMVSKSWIDAMLAPFQSKQPFEFKGKGYHIRAIDGYKDP